MREELRERVLSYMKERRMTEGIGAAVLGVSGGADSVCLLLLLLELRRELKMEFLVIHVEHGIRGEASRKDAAFVQRLCQKLELPCVVRSVDVPGIAKEQRISLEEAARNIRYEIFEEEAAKLERKIGKKTCIAVAHNANDNAETLLYYLARGTGIHGLTGIPPVRGRIIRPLLSLERKEIEAYLKEQKQEYCTDATNLDQTYRRNLIRHRILPAMEEINPAAVEHMVHTAELLEEMEAYLQQEAERILALPAMKDGLKKADVRALAPALRKEVLRLWLVKQLGQKKDIGTRHTVSLEALLEAAAGKEVCLPGGHRVISDYDCLRMKLKTEAKAETTKAAETTEAAETAKTELVVEKEVSAGLLEREEPLYLEAGAKTFGFRLFSSEKTMEIPRKSYTKWFDYDKIKNNLVLRNRQKDDFLVIDSEGRKKLLRRYLMDEKIPRESRDSLILLCSGHQVLWVPGLRISEACKVSETTEKILEVRIMEEEGNE